MIFLDFLKVKIYENMLQNAPFKIFLGGKPAPESSSKCMATPRVASPPQKIKIVAPPPLGKSCIRP